MIDVDSCQTMAELWEARVANTPRRTFLVFESVCGEVSSYSYEEFDTLVGQARGYFASKGIRRSDRVMIAAHNCPEQVAAWLALAGMDAILVAINPCSSTGDIKHFFELCSPTLFMALSPLPDGVRGVLAANALSSDADTPSDDHRMASDPELVFRDAPKGVFADYDPVAAVEPDPLDTLEIIFTSGTTSLPKGVEITQSNAIHSAKTNASSYSLRANDRFFIAVPLFHVDAPYAAIAPSVLTGSAVVLMEKYSASHCIAQCKRYGITLIHCVSMMIKTMLLQPASEDDKTHCVRLASFFMRLSEEERASFYKRFGIVLVNTYGLSESITSVTMDKLTGSVNCDSIGSPTYPYEICIASADKRVVPAGKEGEIWVRGIPGRTLMKGYYGNPEATAEAFVDGEWLRTGDLGHLDGDGNVYFTDRIKNIIKCKGENISAAEVEDCLKKYPDVADAAVVGVPDSICGERAVAVVCLKSDDSIDAETLCAFCRERLASFKVPSAVVFVNELPFTATGKVNRKLLQSVYADISTKSQT